MLKKCCCCCETLLVLTCSELLSADCADILESRSGRDGIAVLGKSVENSVVYSRSLLYEKILFEYHFFKESKDVRMIELIRQDKRSP